MEPFNADKHEAAVAERYRRIARYEAFDTLVDMAMDGVITLDQAKTEWEAEEAEANGTAT